MVYLAFGGSDELVPRISTLCEHNKRDATISTYTDYDPATITEEQIDEFMRKREIPIPGFSTRVHSRSNTERLCRYYEAMLPKRNKDSDPAMVEVIGAVVGMKNNEIRKCHFKMSKEDIKSFSAFCDDCDIPAGNRTMGALSTFTEYGEMGFIHPSYAITIIVVFQCPCAHKHKSTMCNLEKKKNKRARK